MDFHAHAKKNTRKSLVFVALIFTILGLLLCPFGFLFTSDPVVALIMGAFVASIVVTILYFSAAKITLSLTKAQEIDESHREIHNIVEEMALASGYPKPRIYMIDDPAPNAFAVGSRKEGHIVFTSGLLNLLTREELQGVTAHEMAHLKNSDSRMMTIVAGVSVAIALLGDFFGRLALSAGHADDDDYGPFAFIIVFIVGLVVSLIAPLLAVLIQSAVSREREWLADATAVNMTRNPAGLRGALQKMQILPTAPAVTRSSNAHLWISEPLSAQDIQKQEKRARAGKKRGSWTATHPPIEDRIARLTEQERLYG